MKIKTTIKALIRKLRPVKVVKAEISLLQPNQRLVGKKILVTGGNRGLGFSMAKKFTEEGASVLITGRNEDALKKASQEIGCYYLVYDVINVNKADEFLLEADQMLGGINVLVNNAGISLHEGNIRNVTIEQYDSQFETNLRGAYFLTQSFIKLFESKGRKNGNVLFLSSERGQHVDDLPYGIIKAAINSLTQGLAKLLIRSEIRVNAIAPGITATEMTGRTSDNIYAPHYSTGRYYLPEEVAEVACFLISDVAGCVSGQIIICNNGKSINYRK